MHMGEGRGQFRPWNRRLFFLINSTKLVCTNEIFHSNHFLGRLFPDSMPCHVSNFPIQLETKSFEPTPVTALMASTTMAKHKSNNQEHFFIEFKYEEREEEKEFSRICADREEKENLTNEESSQGREARFCNVLMCLYTKIEIVTQV